MKLIGRKYFAKNYASKVIPLFVILSFIQLLGHIKYANATPSEESKYGLTAYAEPCTDECKQRGFPYTWCHKRPSRNGTWIDRDYCSPGPGLTRYLEPCLESCHQDRRERSGDFYWCKTAPTPRGDWDYCSPYPRWKRVTRFIFYLCIKRNIKLYLSLICHETFVITLLSLLQLIHIIL